MLLWMTSRLPVIGQTRASQVERLFNVTHHGAARILYYGVSQTDPHGITSDWGSVSDVCDGLILLYLLRAEMLPLPGGR